MHDLEEHPAPDAVQLEARSQQQHQGDGGEPQVVLAKSSDAGSTSSGDLGKTMSKAWNKFKDTMSKDTMPPAMRKGEWKGGWSSEQHCVRVYVRACSERSTEHDGLRAVCVV